MIFKRLFQAKHLNEDPAVRLLAIDGLSLDTAKDKQALHELAFNDSDVKVSLAALTKLNSFALWLKASETSENKRLKKQAHDWVLAEINKPNSPLISNSEFERFIGESKNTALLEEVLFSNQRLQTNDALALATLLKINKANTTRMYYREHANLAQQQVIISRANDANELSKLLKLTTSQNLINTIQQKLDSLKEQALKPERIKQQATLVISKLLALKERNDYELIFDQKESMNHEFTQLKSDFDCLDEESALVLAEKFLRVNEAIEKRLIDLKDDWQSANELKQTTNAIAEISDRFNEVKLQVDAILASIDDPSLTAQAKLLANALADIQSDVEDATSRPQTVAHKRSLKSIQAEIERYKHFLDNIPIAKEQAMAASSLLSELQQLSIESDVVELEVKVKGLESQWKQLLSATEIDLPNHLLTAWKSEVKKRRAVLTAHVSEVKQQEKKLLGKLKTVQRMVDQGNFKPAIATFRHCTPLYEGLNEKGQRYHKKRYDEVADKIAELQSLQAFIAAPRKPAMLEYVMNLLADKAQVNVQERAAAVKHLRKEWNGLGRLGTEEDDALNAQFDDALEQAFAPCREHYAEQDKLRAENAQVAHALIKELNELGEQDEMATLGRRLSALNRKWKEIGVLEHNERKGLNKSYYAILKPIQGKLDAFYAENAAQKQALITRAEKLIDAEDAGEAADQAKRLQQQWKTIGFAGKPTDDKLWALFRAANDAVFTKVNEKRDALTSAINAIKATIVEQTQNVPDLVAQAQDSTALQAAEEQLLKAREMIVDLPVKAAKAEEHKLDKLFASIDEKRSFLANERVNSQWDALFDVLSNWTNDTLPTASDELPSRFQSLFKGESKTELDRKSLTIQLEILTDLPSNKSDEKRRKELQLSMMAAKLEGSETLSVEDILQEWVSKGPLEKTDSALLKRLKKALTVHLESAHA